MLTLKGRWQDLVGRRARKPRTKANFYQIESEPSSVPLEGQLGPNEWQDIS